MISRDIEGQIAAYMRGAVDMISEAELRFKLKRSIDTGIPLIVKAGFDPTAPDLHLGHTIVMTKMRQFQDFGHQVVFVVGDFTAMIGDPTGKNATRPPLTREQVRAGAETYAIQAFKILDREKTRIEYNSSWLSPLGAEGIIKLMSRYTLARMLEREDFKTRYRGEVPISIHEFCYPLLQAYDSVALRADIELGGSDQLFNLVIGRSIQKEYGLEPQVVLTTPLLEGLGAKPVDGKLTGSKMSKSLDNYVGIAETPRDMFKKLQFIDDSLMWRYYELMSSMTVAEIEMHKAAGATDATHAREMKKRLAMEIVGRFHSAGDAESARTWFEATFEGKGFPADAKPCPLDSPESSMMLPNALTMAALSGSNSEARKLITGGGVTINGERVTDFRRMLDAGTEYQIKVGKDRFAKITIKQKK
ncbi:MAG: tyrosine--tRNA ligase [Myxococcota bacterium]|jgi:tyrosyl-tRNA synthetase